MAPVNSAFTVTRSLGFTWTRSLRLSPVGSNRKRTSWEPVSRFTRVGQGRSSAPSTETRVPGSPKNVTVVRTAGSDVATVVLGIGARTALTGLDDARTGGATGFCGISRAAIAIDDEGTTAETELIGGAIEGLSWESAVG